MNNKLQTFYNSEDTYNLVLLSVSSPIMLGIYSHVSTTQDCNLIMSLSLKGKVSDILPLLFSALLSNKTSNTNVRSPYANNFLLLGVERELQHALSHEKYELEQCIIHSSYYNQILEFYKNHPSHSTLQAQIIKMLEQNKQHHIPFINMSCSLYESLIMLSFFSNVKGVYYSRGVGSLSAIKLTHIFLHTFTLSTKIPIYATNSFYFSQNNEIKAFGNLSFFLTEHYSNLKDNATINLYDSITLQKSINPSTLTLSKILHTKDFNEPCIPLYVTPPL